MCEEGTNLDEHWQHASYIIYLSVTQSGCRYEKINGENSDATVLFSIGVPFHGQQNTATAFNASRHSKKKQKKKTLSFCSWLSTFAVLSALLLQQNKTCCLNIHTSFLHTPFHPIECSEVICLSETFRQDIFLLLFFFFWLDSSIPQSLINLQKRPE